MKNQNFWLYLVLCLGTFIKPLERPKVLHLSFHQGCLNDFDEVGRELGLEVTAWFIPDLPEYFFDYTSKGNSLYNIGHDRAQRIWNKHKEYFNSFDLVITSDTAPLSRIFLQNNFKKPLIIWVCNRFDYCDWASRDCDFPDEEYYRLFAAASGQKNTKIISYTPYEYFYAKYKGIDIGTLTIKPLGVVNDNTIIISTIPDYIDKNQTFFIPPRLDPEQRDFLLQKCADLEVCVYCGSYNGPADLKGFKAILHFPYQWSNLALFENIQNGLIHFVPSLSFVKQLLEEKKPIRFIGYEFSELAEWYNQENAELFIYFDSWEDLKQKIQKTDYEFLREKIKIFAIRHGHIMLMRWRNILSELL